MRGSPRGGMTLGLRSAIDPLRHFTPIQFESPKDLDLQRPSSSCIFLTKVCRQLQRPNSRLKLGPGPFIQQILSHLFQKVAERLIFIGRALASILIGHLLVLKVHLKPSTNTKINVLRGSREHGERLESGSLEICKRNTWIVLL